jgi:hypothetical protein
MLSAPDIEKRFAWEPESRKVYKVTASGNELLMEDVPAADVAHLLVNMFAAGYRSRKRELVRIKGAKHHHMLLESGKVVETLQGNPLSELDVNFVGLTRFDAADIGFTFVVRPDANLYVANYGDGENYEQIAAGVTSDAVAQALSEAWCLGYRHCKREEQN